MDFRKKGKREKGKKGKRENAKRKRKIFE